MARPRATGQHIKLSGLLDKKQKYKTEYNLTEGIIPSEGTVIIAPKKLSKDAKRAWDVTVPALLEMKALSVTDFVQLEQMFVVYDELLTARKTIKEFDKSHSISEDDYIHKRKALNAWFNNTQQTFNSMASRFGMTPSDRTKLPNGETEEKEQDPLEILTNG